MPDQLKKWFLVLAAISVLSISCSDDDLTPGDEIDIRLEHAVNQAGGDLGKAFFKLPSADDLENIPQDPLNPLTPAKVALGKILYHETGLATNPMESAGASTYSCASCHHAAAGFQAGLRQGIGDGGEGFGLSGEGRRPSPVYNVNDLDVQPIRTPSAMNTAFQEVMLWNGQFGATGINAGTEYSWTAGTPKETNHLGYQGLETQAIAGLGVHRMDVNLELIDQLGCKEDFDEIFSSFPEDRRYSKETVGLAIAAYERTLLANQAPFQLWLDGDRGAMSAREKEGALLFFGKAQCNSCHTGPALNKMEFSAIGMSDLEGAGIILPNLQDAATAAKGRGGFTNRDDDMYAFKIPQLYNLKDVSFLGHGGTFGSVREVIEYKNLAVAENSKVPQRYLDERFVPLDLSEDEIEALTAFIERSLYDPALERYLPDHLFSGLCFPNNDDASRSDLGCN